MANHSWSNGDRSNHNSYSGNSRTSTESSELKHNWGFTLSWSSEEQEILEDGLARYSSESSISRYVKIASELQNKTVRDVAMRSTWIFKKENNKRRKQDHKDMVVASNSVPVLCAPAQVLIREEDGTTNDLLAQNEKLLDQISANLKNLDQIPANFTSSQLTENLTLFYKTRENIKNLLRNLKENEPEKMKHMPTVPEELNDQLLDSIRHLSIHQSYHD